MADISEAEAESYRILGIPPGASVKEVRVAFRRQAMLHHPDRNPGNSAAEERFKEILKAYQTALRSIEERAKASTRDAEPGRDPHHSRPYYSQPRHSQPRYAAADGYVYRSRSSANQAISRFLLFVLFTVGPILLIFFVIWANTPTDWIPNCCPEIRIEEETGPFGGPREEEPETPLEEFEPSLDRD